MSRRPRSSIGAALDVVADHWVLLILRELYVGARGWKHLETALHISPATLNRRLSQLVEAGCLLKQQESGRKHVGYELTQQGQELFPFLMAARHWQLRWDARPEANPSSWIHECGAPLNCEATCEACGQPLTPADVTLSNEQARSATVAPRSRRVRAPSVNSGGRRKDDLHSAAIVEVLGDSRATLVMAALLRGFNKFDEIQKFTMLPPATVSSRLRKMQLLGLGHTRLYQEKPDRVLYEPSRSGRELIWPALQLMQWSNRWLGAFIERPTVAIHRQCSQGVGSITKCAACHGPVTLANTQHS